MATTTVQDQGTVASFLGLPLPIGTHWTINRHGCTGRAQVRVTIDKGRVSTCCPTCGAHPPVIYDGKAFAVVGAIIH